MRQLLVAMMLCLTATGQQPGPVAGTNLPQFSVRGRVVNALTGEPVRGALVTINGVGQHSGFSGADGQFEIDGVPASMTTIFAQHPGYTGANGNQMQSVNVRANVDGLVVKMPPSARVSGTVRDADGEPVEGLGLTLTMRMIMNGRKNWQFNSGSSTTDESGQFVIDSLQPGTYLLATTQKAVYPGAPTSGEAARLTYAAQFYPNSADMASAQMLELAAGDDTHIDISVSAVRGARVSFSVDPPVPFVYGNLRSAGGQMIRTGFQRNNKTGKFMIASVPPGSWTLRVSAQQQGDRNQVESGEAVINVGSTDLDNVLVSLSPPLEIPVIVTGGDAPASAAATPPDPTPNRRNTMKGSMLQGPANSTHVQLLPASDEPTTNMNRGGMSSMLSQQGIVTIPNVTPGAYRVVVDTFGGPGICLDSVTSGALDLARNDLVIAGGATPQPINVTLQNNCASLEVTINGKADATLVVVPDSHAKNATFFRQTPLQAGPTTMNNLSPGDYTVYAFTDINGLEYANTEVMRSFSGQRVTLTGGQKSAVTVDVSDRGAK